MSAELEDGAEIPVLTLAGSPYEMGYSHGERYVEAIRRFASERLALACQAHWVGRDRGRDEVLALTEACVEPHRRYSAALMGEVEGMADATGLSVGEVLMVGGFTDLVDAIYNAEGDTPAVPAPAAADECTAFMVPTEASGCGTALFGQTWDMHESGAENAVVLRGAPKDAPAFAVFTSVGAVGMIGLNEAGITIGINNLSTTDGRSGVTWNFVVREALRQRRFEDALACITQAPLAGGHNYMLMDARGHGVNVEATATRQHITELHDRPVVHTNHCIDESTQALQRVRDPMAQSSSEARLERAIALLDRSDTDVEHLMAVTRDPQAICYRGKPPAHIATCGAVIADPAARRMWAVRGSPADREFSEIELN